MSGETARYFPPLRRGFWHSKMKQAQKYQLLSSLLNPRIPHWGWLCRHRKLGEKAGIGEQVVQGVFQS